MCPKSKNNITGAFPTRKKSKLTHATGEIKTSASKWKLQSTERYLQMHCTATQTFKCVYLGIAEGNWKQQYYIITNNHSKTRSLRTTKHYQVISGI